MAEQKSVSSVPGLQGPWASDIQQSGTSQNFDPQNTELPPALPERGRTWGPIYHSVIRAARQTLPVCTAILKNNSDQ
jgi:hypothetical protein